MTTAPRPAPREWASGARRLVARHAVSLLSALVVALVLALLTHPVAAAAADAEGRITQVRSVKGEVVAVLTAQGLAQDERIDVESVRMTLNGEPTEATATAVAGSSQEQDQRAVLAIDTSNSMRGAPLVGAQEAARAFAAAVPPAVLIGLVTFDDEAREVVAPTTDRNSLFRAIDGLQTSPQTTMYDGLIAALAAVEGSALRTTVLLTDGRDTVSTASFEEALAAASDSGATVDTVGLGRTRDVREELRTISAATGGVFSGADQASELAKRFSDSGQAIANQVVVRAPFPPELDGRGATVTIEATAGELPLKASAFVTLSPDVVTAGTSAGSESFGPVSMSAPAWQVPDRGLYVGLALLGVGLFALLGVGALAITRNQDDDRRLLGRLRVYSLSDGHPVKTRETTAFGSSQAAVRAVSMARDVVDGRDIEARLEHRLDASGIPLKPAEWLIVHTSAAIGSALLILLLSGGSIPASVLGLLVGAVVPWLTLSVAQSRRRQAFYEQLPDTLQLMASSLTAGHSLPQALDTVAKQAQDPIAAEFRRALIETRLGVTPEDALEAVANRMSNDDFGWVVMAIRVQRQVGGNLAEILTTVADVLREREYLRRQVKVLSAEGRLSAWIIGLVPLAFAAFLMVTRPDMLSIMWTDPRGIVLSVMWVLMLGAGSVWLSRVVKVEV